jgi:hypothetical protein
MEREGRKRGGRGEGQTRLRKRGGRGEGQTRLRKG